MVAVLMSSYNGAQYIQLQIDSILGQDGVTVILFIRDDGSSDNTLEIIQPYLDADNVFLTVGENVGVVAGFMSLINTVPDDFDYYALADQDDVWKADKLLNAVSLLENYDYTMPLLYCSALKLVDEQLNDLGSMNYSYVPRYKNAIVENIVTGCTSVFNSSAKKIIHPVEYRSIAMHDWWLYLLISAFGVVVYDEQSSILYRQHSQNVVGGVTSWTKLKYRIKCYLFDSKKFVLRSKQIELFIKHYGNLLSPEKKKIAENFIFSKQGLLNRIRYAFKHETKMQRKLDNILLFFLLLFGRY